MTSLLPVMQGTAQIPCQFGVQSSAITSNTVPVTAEYAGFFLDATVVCMKLPVVDRLHTK